MNVNGTDVSWTRNPDKSGQIRTKIDARPPR
jgi:hypothetical protein